MKKRFLFSLVSFLLASVTSSFAQPSTFEGTWTLQEVELYRYSDVDSVKVNNDLLSTNSTSDIHDKLSFSNDKCELDIDGNPVLSPFVVEDSTLKLYYSPAPAEYEIIEQSEKLVLYHKYFAADPNNQQQVVQYGVKLTYQK